MNFNQNLKKIFSHSNLNRSNSGDNQIHLSFFLFFWKQKRCCLAAWANTRKEMKERRAELKQRKASLNAALSLSLSLVCNCRVWVDVSFYDLMKCWRWRLFDGSQAATRRGAQDVCRRCSTKWRTVFAKKWQNCAEKCAKINPRTFADMSHTQKQRNCDCFRCDELAKKKLKQKLISRCMT